MKNKIFIALILTLAFTLITAQAQNGKVRKEMLVSTDWLAKNLKAKDLVILHVAANKGNFDKAHLESSRFVAWNEMTATRDGMPNELPTVENLQKLFSRLGLGNNGRIVIYGDLSGLMAARAFFTLDYIGHGGRVALLDGGLEKWQAEKRPVSNAETNFSAAEFTPQVNQRTVTFLQTVSDVSWQLGVGKTGNTLLLDARPPDEFSGVKPGDGIPRGGHIPGAINMFWMENLISKENPVMKSVAELKKLYEGKGFVPSKQVISYCRTGGQASHAYFTLQYLGYDVVMYDGSFFEWSNQSDAPIEK